MAELDESDEGQANRRRDEIVCIWLRVSVMKPPHDI